MAFQLFNSGAAQAYANSFQPWKANGGFDNVKSTVATDILTKVPFLNFQAEVEMAKAGLMGYTGTKKQKMVNDTQKELLEMRLDFAESDREDRQKENKRAALARMLSGGGGAARAIANRGSSAELAGVMRGGDPLSGAVAISNAEARLQGDMHSRIAPVTAATKTAIQGTPAPPPSSNTTLQVQPQTVKTPEVKPAPSVKSEENDFDYNAAMAEVYKAWQQTNRPAPPSTSGDQQ